METLLHWHAGTFTLGCGIYHRGTSLTVGSSGSDLCHRFPRPGSNRRSSAGVGKDLGGSRDARLSTDGLCEQAGFGWR